MKTLLALAAVALVPAAAHAHPGGHTLTCTSPKGARQAVKLELQRANGVGWAPPSFTITVGGVAHAFTTDDEMKAFGSILHDAPLGVIVVEADNNEDAAAKAHGGFSVTAIPASVKAYDRDGKRRTWRIEDEDDACHDANGKATFRAAFTGWLADETGQTALGAQILDCELAYDSGMAC